MHQNTLQQIITQTRGVSTVLQGLKLGDAQSGHEPICISYWPSNESAAPRVATRVTPFQ